MTIDSIKSPIYYTGNKFRLIDQLQGMIPEEMNTFVDVFGGSGTMAINFSRRSKKTIYNELDKRIYNLFNFLMKCDHEWLHEKIIQTSKDNGFWFDGQRWEVLSSLEQEEFKVSFYKFRDWLNESGRQNNPFYIFYMMNYSFCNGMTFNSRDEMSISCGATFYKRNVIDINLNQSQYYMNKTPYQTFNLSFELLLEKIFDELGPGDFVYLDPPYFGTLAHYNEGWSFKHEILLLEWIDKLHAKGIHFGLSNIIRNKSVYNKHLVEWAEANDYFIYRPKIDYRFGPNQSSESEECFITNATRKEQMSLFQE